MHVLKSAELYRPQIELAIKFDKESGKNTVQLCHIFNIHMPKEVGHGYVEPVCSMSRCPKSHCICQPVSQPPHACSFFNGGSFDLNSKPDSVGIVKLESHVVGCCQPFVLQQITKSA